MSQIILLLSEEANFGFFVLPENALKSFWNRRDRRYAGRRLPSSFSGAAPECRSDFFVGAPPQLNSRRATLSPTAAGRANPKWMPTSPAWI
jgi:hypothetical protein